MTSFLTEQIAGDQLPDRKPNDRRLAALGFLRSASVSRTPDDTIDERIDALTKCTVGLTVACARCHDHKFDPIPTADYYALHGILNSTVEPYERPEVPSVYDPAQRGDFDQRMRNLEVQNRQIIYDIMQQRLLEFMDNAEGYLVVLPLPGRSPERFDALKKYNLAPENQEILGSLRVTPDHPVFGPYRATDARPRRELRGQSRRHVAELLNNPKKPVNPLVVAALRDLKPQSVADLAKAYGQLFAQVKPKVSAYFAARSAPSNKTLPVDDATAEVINALYHIPPGDELDTGAQQLTFFADGKRPQPWMSVINLAPHCNLGKLLFPAMNELYLTHPARRAAPWLWPTRRSRTTAHLHSRRPQQARPGRAARVSPDSQRPRPQAVYRRQRPVRVGPCHRRPEEPAHGARVGQPLMDVSLRRRLRAARPMTWAT